MTDDTAFKTFCARGYETRNVPVEYLVEAETADEALDKMLVGSTVAERDLGLGEVADRNFDAGEVREMREVPIEGATAAADFSSRMEGAFALVTDGMELLDRVLAVVPLADRPGTARVTTTSGTFLIAIRLEDYVPEED